MNPKELIVDRIVVDRWNVLRICAPDWTGSFGEN